MNLFIENYNDELIPFELSTLSKDFENKIPVCRVGNNDYFPTQKDIEDTFAFFNSKGVLALILPFQFDLSSIEFEKDKNYLFTLRVPKTYSKEDMEETHKVLKDVFGKYPNIVLQVLPKEMNMEVSETK